jgi:hypothetical protein
MAYFDELDRYLSLHFSTDNWEDSASLYAIELVQKLTPDDWELLESSWRNKSHQWQRYCASVMPWGDLSRAIPVLFEMIQTADDELATIAADSLRDIHSNIAQVQVPPSVRSRLQEVARNHPGITARVINELLERL